MSRLLAATIVGIFLITMAGYIPSAKAAEAPWRFVDLDGQSHEPFADESTRAIALVFITPDCPIANFYQPTLRRLGEEFADRGISLVLIYSDPEVTVAAAKRHVERFKITAPVALDHDQTLAQRVKAKITPEAFVIDRDGQIAYRGRIDNFYEALGRKRHEATEHDFRDALQAVAEGLPVAVPVTKALGCHIPYVVEPQDAATGSSTVKVKKVK